MTEEKRPGHFNRGTVWGRVASLEEEISTKKTPYINFTIETPNELYGNIKTYGRLWKQKAEDFLAYHKQHPFAAYKFIGFFGQYESAGKVRSNFTFTQWQPYDGSEFRTAFVLVGEVVATEKEDGDGMIRMIIARPAGEGYEVSEEPFEVYTLKPESVDELHIGDIIKAKRYLRYKLAEDEFGDTPENSIVKPYVMDLKILWTKEAF
jgi:hypothetical protein